MEKKMGMAKKAKMMMEEKEMDKEMKDKKMSMAKKAKMMK